MNFHGHICSCFYYAPLPPNSYSYRPRVYLPQVDIKAHTTILSTTSRTTLTQTFLNTSSTKGIRSLRYAFPLYEGVSVVGFKCHVGDRIITGLVKEKDQARREFTEAVEKGEVAGLLEQLPEASDVFSTEIGNVPPGAKVVVEITYLGELKHDAEVDGVRFTIPTFISPRYGNYPGKLADADVQYNNPGTFNVTVDAELEEGFFIREMRSPSHPISVSVGVKSTDADDVTPSMNKASASLSLDTSQLDTDFVLQVVSKEFGNPTAVLEKHPTVTGSRALMATLVPKFQLSPQRPEIVFVCDRSGSMGGSRMNLLKNALNVFLKSLPVGVAFNICSFGSHYSFLWNKSKPYNQENLEHAIKHAASMEANFGGTEMLKPVKDTIERRAGDRPLEVFLVTDGEIWDQENLFKMINEKIHEKKQPVRVFTLGIGNGVSHSLIEGVARAGNGFSQAVGEGEKLDSKVIRMLKGALFPHISDYTLEVKYADDGEDDFEIVEKVADSLKVSLNLEEEKQAKQSITKKVISLFDKSAEMDSKPPTDDKDPFKHLPDIPVPKLLQAPNNIPSLFPFNRTSIYLLISPEAAKGTPKSVILRGTCAEGPLELEIPVKVTSEPGETIHQLAAKKAVAELEEGRGWLYNSRHTADGKLLKDKYPSMFEEMVRREAVRLGVKYQVGGKWCSFIATEKKDKDAMETGDDGFEFLDADSDAKTLAEGAGAPTIESLITRGYRYVIDCRYIPRVAESAIRDRDREPTLPRVPASPTNTSPSLDVDSTIQSSYAPSSFQRKSASRGGGSSTKAKKRSASGLFGLGGASAPPPPAPSVTPFGRVSQQLSGGFGSSTGAQQQQAVQAQLSGVPWGGPPGTQRVAQSAARNQQMMMRQASPQSITPQPTGYQAGALFGGAPQGALYSSVSQTGFSMPTGATSAAPVTPPPKSGMARSRGDVHSRVNACLDTAEDSPIMDSCMESDGSNGGYDFMMGSFAPQESRKMSSNARRTKIPLGMADAVLEPESPPTSDGNSPLQALVALQTFSGSWEWNEPLFRLIGVSIADAQKAMSADVDKSVMATALAVRFFETKLKSEKDSWELLVEKARDWVDAQGGKDVWGIANGVLGI